MRLAWFRAPTPPDAYPLDEVDGLIHALASEHELHVVTSAHAHDFVWRHFRVPYDVCVFELDNTSAHAFMWPYLLHYGGVLLLRARTLHDSRADTLIREGRSDDYVAEFMFNEGHPPYLAHRQLYASAAAWAMLRVPLVASRLTVVSHAGIAEALQDEYPEARVRYAPLPVRELQPEKTPAPPTAGGGVIFGVTSADRVDLARRAFSHARETGAAARLLIDAPDHVVRQADVILTLPCSGYGGPQTVAIAAMACGKAVVVPETDVSADWPVLDPQTWHPRAFATDAPVGVSIDPRDEEHSLALAMRRLAADTALRIRLGEAGRAWWRAHATVARAAETWRSIVREAATLNRPTRPSNWPAHLDADATCRTREILEGFGVRVDPYPTGISGGAPPLL
jgi:hypothetical protein